MSFAGIRPILHAPFAPGLGAPLLVGELPRLVAHVRAQGVDGVVALGLASEAWALTEAERDAFVAAAVDAADGLPVTVGIEGATAVAADRAERARRLGAQTLMVLPPPRADPASLLVHYGAVGQAGLPILVQDSPQVTGVTLAAEALLGLAAEVALVRAVKVEGPAAGPKVSALVAGGLDVVAGWGGLHYPESLERGAIGLMPGCDLAAAFVALHVAWRAGDREGAERTYATLLPYLAYQAQSLDLIVLAAKRELVRRGVLEHAALRDPAAALDAVQARTLDRLAAGLGAAGVKGFGPGLRPGLAGTAGAGPGLGPGLAGTAGAVPAPEDRP
jgi:4-hydroxy-tetrahydrodipicolinate synthase